MFFSVSNGEELTFESFSSEENALNFRTRESKWLFTQRRLKLGPDSCDTIARSCVWVPCNGVDLCRLQHKLVHTIVTNLVVSLSRFKCLRLSKSNTSDLFTILTCILENRHVRIEQISWFASCKKCWDVQPSKQSPEKHKITTVREKCIVDYRFFETPRETKIDLRKSGSSRNQG